MARPKIEINADQVEKLAAMQCTNEEIADVFSCHVDTITRRFADALQRGRSMGKMTMKRKLFEKVQDGELGALIWWGKNFAGMSDKTEVENRNTNFNVVYEAKWNLPEPPKDVTPDGLTSQASPPNDQKDEPKD